MTNININRIKDFQRSDKFVIVRSIVRFKVLIDCELRSVSNFEESSKDIKFIRHLLDKDEFHFYDVATYDSDSEDYKKLLSSVDPEPYSEISYEWDGTIRIERVKQQLSEEMIKGISRLCCQGFSKLSNMLIIENIAWLCNKFVYAYGDFITIGKFKLDNEQVGYLGRLGFHKYLEWYVLSDEHYGKGYKLNVI